jgi:hypothetical protein
MSVVRRSSVKVSARLLQREIAVSLIVFLAVPFGGSATAFAQQTAPSQQVEGTSSSQQQPAQGSDIGNPKPVISTSPAPINAPESGVPKTPQAPQESGPPAPLGTAVAPYGKGIGIAASRPAGVVIAPAKQRRTRSFVIKLSVLIGACVAVGTVVALSNGSPSQPQK